MNDKKIPSEIYKLHRKTLPYTNHSNKKLLICFSGIPGAGKTYVAKIIEKRYKGVRLTSDEIRKIIHELGKKYPALLEEKTREEILKEYLIYLIEHKLFKNGLIILDSGIERKHELISKKAKENNFKLIIISIEVSRKTAEERARKRKGGTDEHFDKNIARWIRENKEFSKKIKPRLIARNEKRLNLGKIFKKLDKITK